MLITGNTKVFAIIADPVAQVRTPEMLNAYFAEHRIDAVIVPIHVSAADLPQAMTGLCTLRNLGGLVVTVPHKKTVAALCTRLGPTASVVGAVNTVRRLADGSWVGDMFDGEGFVAGLRGQGRDLAGLRVLMVGAGGAAGAIALALARADVAYLGVANRTRERAIELVQRVRQALPQARIEDVDADPRGYDMVVNATSLGMRADDALPLDVARLDTSSLVVEVIAKPPLTALLQAARQRGCAIHEGRHMLQAQVELMARFLLDDSHDSNDRAASAA